MPPKPSRERSNPPPGDKSKGRTAAESGLPTASSLAQAGEFLTTAQGVRLPDTDHSLKAGRRGPTLLEDFHLREKITHFDHERIPERVVHARGAAAHGMFRSYGTAASATQGARSCRDGSRDAGVRALLDRCRARAVRPTRSRDVRGFAVKFYTDEGNFDLVGNNMPVFFIQDGIKFPDFIHAAKPQPDREIPQAQTAHDTFWDFVSLHTEATHTLMWTCPTGRSRARTARWRASASTPSVWSTREARRRSGEVPLEAGAGRALAGLGGGAARGRHRSGLPPPRPGGRRSRPAHSPSGSSACRSSPTPRTRRSRASTCSTRPSSCPKNWRRSS